MGRPLGRVGRLAIAGVGILASVALLWWLAGSPDASRVAHAPQSVAPRAPASPALGELPGAPEGTGLPEARVGEASSLSLTGDSPQAPPPDSTLASLTGRLVHDDDGLPVADAEVLLFTNGRSSDGRLTSSHQDIARTDAGGAFTATFAGHARLWLVRALPGPGHAMVEERPDLEIPLGETRSIELRARRGGSVSGVVVDEADRPVAGATVLAWSAYRSNVESRDGPPAKPHARVAADGAGRFVFHGAGPIVVLMPEAAGLAAWRGAQGRVNEGEVVDGVKLVVGPGAVIRGRVVDSRHRPVPPVWVVATRAANGLPDSSMTPAEPLNVAAVTDADGRFALPRVAVRSWRISVAEPSHQPYEIRVQAGSPVLQEREELLIVLEAGCQLEGMVTGADGAPLDAAAVLLWGASANGSTWMPTEQGRFAFDGLLLTENALLAVTAEGHAPQVIEGLVLRADPTPPLAIRLEPELAIAGRVVDEQDRPVAGAALHAAGTRRALTGEWKGRSWDDFLPSSRRQQTSDKEGRFRLGRLHEGELELTVEDPRNPGQKRTLDVAAGELDLLVRLDASAMALGSLAGDVRDAETGQPLDDFSVWLFPLEPERQVSGATLPGRNLRDAGGRYVLHGIPPGRYVLQARAEGYAKWSGDELAIQLGEQRSDIAFLRERTLRLRVVDQDGEPVHLAFLHFEDDRGRRYDPSSQPKGDGSLGATDRKGEVVATGLPADRIVVVLKYALVGGTGVGRREHRASFDLRVQPQGTQVVVVQRPEHRWLVVSAAVSSEEGLASVRDTADEATMGWFVPLFESGRLRLPDRRVECTVRDASGEVVDEASCEPAADGESWISSTRSGGEAGGPWLMARLPAGEATVEIRAAGSDPIQLEIPAGEADVKRLVVLVPATR